MSDELYEAIDHAFIAQYEGNFGGEPANVTDGLFAIARALNRIAEALNQQQPQQRTDDDPGF